MWDSWQPDQKALDPSPFGDVFPDDAIPDQLPNHYPLPGNHCVTGWIPIATDTADTPTVVNYYPDPQLIGDQAWLKPTATWTLPTN